MGKAVKLKDLPIDELSKLHLLYKEHRDKLSNLISSKYSKEDAEWHSLAKKNRLAKWDEKKYPEFQDVLNDFFEADELQGACRYWIIKKLNGNPVAST